QPHKRAIKGVGCSIAVRMNADARVRPFGPILAALRIHRIGLRAEVTYLAKRQFPPPLAFLNLHRNIVPGRVRQPESSALRMNNLLSRGAPPSQIRAQKSAPSGGDWLIAAGPQRKLKPIA